MQALTGLSGLSGIVAAAAAADPEPGPAVDEDFLRTGTLDGTTPDPLAQSGRTWSAPLYSTAAGILTSAAGATGAARLPIDTPPGPVTLSLVGFETTSGQVMALAWNISPDRGTWQGIGITWNDKIGHPTRPTLLFLVGLTGAPYFSVVDQWDCPDGTATIEQTFTLSVKPAAGQCVLTLNNYTLAYEHATLAALAPQSDENYAVGPYIYGPSDCQARGFDVAYGSPLVLHDTFAAAGTLNGRTPDTVAPIGATWQAAADYLTASGYAARSGSSYGAARIALTTPAESLQAAAVISATSRLRRAAIAWDISADGLTWQGIGAYWPTTNPASVYLMTFEVENGTPTLATPQTFSGHGITAWGQHFTLAVSIEDGLAVVTLNDSTPIEIENAAYAAPFSSVGIFCNQGAFQMFHDLQVAG